MSEARIRSEKLCVTQGKLILPRVQAEEPLGCYGESPQRWQQRSGGVCSLKDVTC